MTSRYTTRTTWLGNEYGCRIYRDDTLVVEARVKNRIEIGAAFRDMLRTLDKGFSPDAFTAAARRRKFAEGAPQLAVKHYWGGKNDAA
jgi:hypothetical protein